MSAEKLSVENMQLQEEPLHYGKLDLGQMGEFIDPGIELRDFLAAHAPAEPQFWFMPCMDSERPHPVMEQQRIYHVALNQQEMNEWDKEHMKQRLLQWPYAWADEQLEQREK